jgi:uncharacterized damage-inducible protein DinB
MGMATAAETASATGIVSLQQLSDAFARNVNIIGRQTAGLTHADSLLQPAMRGNCMNWVIGHIAASRNAILRMLGEEPVLTAAQVERYKRGSEPVLGEEDGIMTLPALLDALNREQAEIAAGLDRATPETLAQDANFGGMTVAQALFTLYFHECYHTGQTEYLRQLAGTNDQII